MINPLGGEAKKSHCMTEANNRVAKPRGDYESGYNSDTV